MNKSIKIISSLLGVAMFSFGSLKFMNPFKGWYAEQIIKSELPFPLLAYWGGQLGEILVGALLLFLVFYHSKINTKSFKLFFFIGNAAIISMMMGAIYIHLHPNVPSDILPLKISPPFIPGLFLVLAVVNIYKSRLLISISQ